MAELEEEALHILNLMPNTVLYTISELFSCLRNGKQPVLSASRNERDLESIVLPNAVFVFALPLACLREGGRQHYVLARLPEDVVHVVNATWAPSKHNTTEFMQCLGGGAVFNASASS